MSDKVQQLKAKEKQRQAEAKMKEKERQARLKEKIEKEKAKQKMEKEKQKLKEKVLQLLAPITRSKHPCRAWPRRKSLPNWVK